MAVNFYDSNNNNEQKVYNVHKIIAEVFIEKPEGLDFVNHIDHNRYNNNVTNLDWTTF